ncbi:EEIG1/EHBP1 N-terminal domain-containing protein, partial [Tanacetum coccineum]
MIIWFFIASDFVTAIRDEPGLLLLLLRITIYGSHLLILSAYAPSMPPLISLPLSMACHDSDGHGGLKSLLKNPVRAFIAFKAVILPFNIKSIPLKCLYAYLRVDTKLDKQFQNVDIFGPYLRDIFPDPTKQKVMHGKDKGILWLQRDFSIYVSNMFDTGQAIRMTCRSLHGSIEYRNQGEEHTLSFEVMEKPKLSRFRSWNMRKRRRDVTLLNKAYGKSIGSDIFEVGKWEKRIVKIRDGKLELQTKIFLATIDQMKWRNLSRSLCKEEAHKDNSLDQHFDLDTVIQAQVRPLEVEIQNGESTSEECVYIVSWHDHFFLLKKEKYTMYIIDMLGERLTEGCDEAYILKFHEESMTHNVEPETKIPKAESEGLDND